jgi:hypothetical protein
MSGGQVAYNLRPNKFVERQLFVELLTKVCVGPPEEYVYVSLGGPQLEDQRLVHQRLGLKKLVSLEADSIIHKRQLFNRRPSFIKCCNKPTKDFVKDFDAFTDLYNNEEEFIIWFDYSNPKARHQQVNEYETLLSQLKDGDIIKITMNANPNTLGEIRSGENQEDGQKKRLEVLREQLDDYLPDTLEYTTMTNPGLVPILCNVIENASLKAVRDDPCSQPIPLAAFFYRDGPHQMLTVTVRRTRKTKVESFCKKLESQGWEYLPSNWKAATKINVPNLTAIEQLHIEKLLFSENHEIIHNELPFRFHKNPEKSLEILEAYAAHYRRYPNYLPVAF